MKAKPRIFYDPCTPDGNSFCVFAHAVNAMNVYPFADASKRVAEMRDRVLRAVGYEETIRMIREYVELIER